MLHSHTSIGKAIQQVKTILMWGRNPPLFLFTLNIFYGNLSGVVVSEKNLCLEHL
jgi:hypothetical protein